ncbi:MAG: vWA domain-containing protein [Rhizomicrobium sp.]
MTSVGARARGDAAHTAALAVDEPVVELGHTVSLQVRVQTPSLVAPEKLPPRDVLFVLDRSPSMGVGPDSPYEEMIQAVSDFLAAMPANFRSGVVAFDSGAQLVAPISANHQRNRGILMSMPRGDGTSIAAGLTRTREAIATVPDPNPAIVVLLTDGSDESAQALVAARDLVAAGRGVTLLCAGFGREANMELLQQIAGKDRSFKIEATDQIRALFDFLSARVTGRIPVVAVLECDVGDPSPWKFVEGRQHPPFKASRLGEVTTYSWVRPVLEDGIQTFTIELEARCPGWHRIVRGGRVLWRTEGGGSETTAFAASPRVLLLPGWLAWAFPLINPIVHALLVRADCIHEDKTETRPEPENTSPAVFNPLPAPGLPPFSPSIKPTLFVCLGGTGRSAGLALCRRMFDRDIRSTMAPCVFVDVGEGRTVGAEGASFEVNIAVDTRLWVTKAAFEGSTAARSFVPAEVWLRRGEVLHTYFGAGENRALARLAVLLEPEKLQLSLDSAMSRAAPEEIQQVILMAGADDAAASALILEVAHMCAKYNKPCIAILAASSRLSKDRLAEAALAAELDRALSCRGEVLISDRGGVEVGAGRLLDSVIVVGDRHVQGDASLTALVDSAWSIMAYPAFRPSVDAATVNGAARMRIEARAAPRRLLWEAIRERAIGDIIASWVLGRATPKEGAELAARLADRAVNQFWSGRETSTNFPPHFQVIAAPHASRSIVGDLPRNETTRSDEQSADLAFAKYLSAWLRVYLQKRDEAVWPLSGLLLALRQVEAQLHASAVTYADGASSSDRASEWLAISGIAQRYRLVVSATADKLSRWHDALTGDPWPVDSGLNLRSGLAGTSALAAEEKLKVVTQDLPQSAGPSLQSYYRPWIEEIAPQILERLGLWTQVSPGGAIELELLGPAGQVVKLPDVESAFRSWLDIYSSGAMELLDDAVMQRFVQGIYGISIGARAQELGGMSTPAGLREDRAFAATVEIVPMPIEDALGVRGLGERPNLPYAWPEETHAARIRALYENRVGERPPAFSGTAVSALRDPPRALTILQKLLDGRISARAGLLFEGDREIGPAFVQPNAVGEFARTLRSARACDGWPVITQSSEDFLASLEKLDAFRELREAPGWEEWRAVIRGLVLDAQASHDARRDASGLAYA